MLLRRSLVVSGCLVAVVWNGCDSDEETDTQATRPMTEAEREPVPTDEVPPAPTEEIPPVTEPETETLPPEEKAPQAPPEEQPGGAGDEEPARSLALFTGRGGRITPRVIRVPAFISIRVELRSVEDREYGLEFDGERIRVSGGLASVSTTIEGLRPGRAVIGNPVGAGNRVRIEATAEPGP